MALCPHCNAPLSNVTLEHVTVGRWHGASYSCPYCLHLLSVGIDPIAIKSDIVTEVVEELAKKLRRD